MNPVDEEWREGEMVKFLDYLVALNCVEGEAEVSEKDLKQRCLEMTQSARI